MQALTFFMDGAGTAGEVHPSWKVSNRALHRLIQHRAYQLQRARRLAGRIEDKLGDFFPLTEALSRLTCPWCPHPCCVITQTWFDFLDMLFAHLRNAALPPGPLRSRPEEACRFLKKRGCRLPRLMRPWACTLYTCATQYKILYRQGPSEVKKFEDAIESITHLRRAMELEFVQALKGRKQST
jgi:hypothetical protein